MSRFIYSRNERKYRMPIDIHIHVREAKLSITKGSPIPSSIVPCLPEECL